MKAPKKIYIQTNAGEAFSSKWTTIPFRDFENTEYIRKDIVDETIKTAEDHAYFAGQEKFREKLLKCINEIRAIPHENAVARDLAFQEIINKINSI